MLHCVNGYHSFKSVAHEGMLELMRVEFGAKYGRFNIRDSVVGRKTVSREVASTTENVRTRLAKRLTEPIRDGR